MLDNQSPVSPGQQPQVNTSPNPEQPVVTNSPAKKSQNKWIFVGIIIAIVLGIAGYFYMNRFLTQHPTPKTSSIPTTLTSPSIRPSPTVSTSSANPTSGNLYTDIKTKLDQVIK